eukprot:jgi/Mesvir1/13575/Mv02993-RA.1
MRSPRTSVSHRVSLSGRAGGTGSEDLARALELLEKNSRDRNPLAHRFGGIMPAGFPARSPRTSICRHTSISSRLPVEMMRTGVAVDDTDLSRAVESLERRARHVTEKQRKLKEEEQALAARERALVSQKSQEQLLVTASSSSSLGGYGPRDALSSRGSSSQGDVGETATRGFSRSISQAYNAPALRRRTPSTQHHAASDARDPSDSLHAARRAGVLSQERAAPIWQAPELEELIRQKRAALDARAASVPQAPAPMDPSDVAGATLASRRGLDGPAELEGVARGDPRPAGARELRRRSYDSVVSRLATMSSAESLDIPPLPLGDILRDGEAFPWSSGDGESASPSPPSRVSVGLAESPSQRGSGATTPGFGRFDSSEDSPAGAQADGADAHASHRGRKGGRGGTKAGGSTADSSPSDSPSPDGHASKGGMTDRKHTPPSRAARGTRYRSMDGEDRTPPLMAHLSRERLHTASSTVRGTADTREASSADRAGTSRGGAGAGSSGGKDGGRMVPVPVQECVRVLCGEVRRLKDELEEMDMRQAREIEEGRAEIVKQAEKSIRAATEMGDEFQVSINILSEGPKWSLAWSREMDGTKARLQAEINEIATRHEHELARRKKLQQDRDMWNPEELARLEAQLAATHNNIAELEEELSRKQWEVAELVAASEAARQNVATAKEKYGTVKLTYIRAMEDLKEATEDISDIARKVSGLSKKNRRMHLVSVMRNAGIAAKAAQAQAAEQPSLLAQWQQQAAAAAAGGGGSGSPGSPGSSPRHPGKDADGRQGHEGGAPSGPSNGGGGSDQPLGRARFITWSDRIRASEQRKRVLEEKVAKMRARVSTAKKELASVNEALAKVGLAEGGGLGQLVREKDAAVAERDFYQRRYREALARIVAAQQSKLRARVKEEWKQGLEEGIGGVNAQGWGPGLRRLPGEKPGTGTLGVWWPEDEDAGSLDSGNGYVRDPPDGWDENLFGWSDFSDSELESLLRTGVNA